MRLPELNLRVRIFLFFALLMVASSVIIGSAIVVAHQSAPDQLARLLATYTGVAAVIIVLILALVWQLFDRYVASALHSLARQMQTALHADIVPERRGLNTTEDYQYLGSVSEAADELIKAYQELKCVPGSRAVENASLGVQATCLAALVRDLQVGVLVMNRHHEIVLYNQHAFGAINCPEFVGLARSALTLFQGPELLAATDQLFEQSGLPVQQNAIKLSLKLAHKTHCVTGRMSAVSGVDGASSGYLLLLDDYPDKLPSASNSRQKSTPAVEPRRQCESTKALPLRPEFYDFELFDRAPLVNTEHRALSTLDYVVFDTETTGLRPSNGDQMIAIAAVRIVNGRVLKGESFSELIQPGIPVPARSTVFHGITDSMLEGKPGIAEVLPRFVQFAGDAVLVAHNAAFDMRFIELQEQRCNVRLQNPVLDTALLSAFLHDHTHLHTLDELAKRYEVCIQGRHTASGDAQATARIFIKLIGQLSSRNVNTLCQALEVSSKMTHVKRHQKAY